MKTKREIIAETAKVYSDPVNRGIDDKQACLYLTPDGKMCALGRCLIDPTIEGGSLCYFASDGWMIGNREWSDDLLKEEYRGHLAEFWEDLQMWHDDDTNFTAIDISILGRRALDTLHLKWDEN